MLKTIAKIALALGIIIWMVASGKLDFSLVKRAFSGGFIAYIGVAIIFTQAMISSYRWKMLLDLKASSPIPKLSALALTWIGLFFNTVLPGAVTGDLLKLVYAKDIDKNLTRSFLFSSVMLDRILGLMGLLFLSGIFTLTHFEEMFSISKGMKSIVSFNLVLFFGAIVFIMLLFIPKKLQTLFLNLFNKIPVVGAKISKVMSDVWLIGSNKKTLLTCLALSMVMQFFNIMAFWLLTKNFYGKDLLLSQVFTFVPAGLIAVAIPISPSGAGVGHLIFNELFGFVGISGGASLFNLYFLAAVCVNLLGVIPYLFFGKHHNLKEAENF